MDYINHVKQQPIQGIAGFGGGATGAAFRSGGALPEVFSSLSEWNSFSPDDGKYTFKLSGGTNTEFDAYVIGRDGGWVKALSYYGGNNMSGSSALNAGGNWTDQEQGNYYGKLHSSDMNALMTTSKFLFRVHGHASDPLLNDGDGTGRYEGGQSLSNWGTAQDPTNTYGLDLDLTSDGTYEYQTTYTNDTRVLCTSCCGHIANIWVSDHNFNATGTLPTGTSHPICWTFGTTHVHTNLHWMTKDGASSGGTINWGGSGTGTGFHLFLK